MESCRCSWHAQRAYCEHQRSAAAATAAAAKHGNAAAAVPTPQLSSVLLLSVGVSSVVSLVSTHTEKLRQMSGRGGRSWPA